MGKPRLLSAVLASSLAFSLLPPLPAYAEGAPAEPVAAPADYPEGSYVPGEVLVVYNEGASELDVSRSEQAESVEQALSAQSVVDDHALPMAVFEVAEDSSVEEAVAELEADPAVLIAQPNFVYTVPEAVEVLDGPEADEPVAVQDVSAASFANDPMISKQTYLDSIGVGGAWELTGNLATSANRPSIALIDAGFDVAHPDVAANVVATRNVATGSADVSDYPNRYVGDHHFGHGTRVAGIAAGVANNGQGVAGVSYNAGLVCVKIADETAREGYEMTTQSLINAYNWLLDESSGMSPAERYNVRVINVSLGTKVSGSTYEKIDRAAHQAILRARNRNIATVCAAGNKGASAAPYNDFPGDYVGCVSVMALDAHDQLASFSNYNVDTTRTKDIAAPGSSIWTTSPTSGASLYGSDSGTSMAAPIASAVLAMEFAVDPELTAEAAIGILYATATDLGDQGWDRYYGWGKLNAEAAVLLALAEELEPDISRIGWVHVEDDYYHIEPDGSMTTLWRKIDGAWYYFGIDGRMERGWHKIDGYWYYLNPDGRMKTGWLAWNGHWYYLNPGYGNMRTGWLKWAGKWYYLNHNGEMHTGWLYDHTYGAYYYLYGDGSMARSTWIYDGGRFYVGADGRYLY